MISAAAAAEDYRSTKRDCILIGREAQRAREAPHDLDGILPGAAEADLTDQRDQPSPSAPLAAAK